MILASEDVNDINDGEPLYAHFEPVDWALTLIWNFQSQQSTLLPLGHTVRPSVWKEWCCYCLLFTRFIRMQSSNVLANSASIWECFEGSHSRYWPLTFWRGSNNATSYTSICRHVQPQLQKNVFAWVLQHALEVEPAQASFGVTRVTRPAHQTVQVCCKPECKKNILPMFRDPM